MIVTRYVFVYRLAEEQYLLLNCLTGAVDVVARDVINAFAAVRQGKPPKLCEADITRLLDRGYLYPCRADEEALVARVVEVDAARRAQTQPICFVLAPTVACNLRCPYCFEPHKMHEDNVVMTREQIELAFVALESIRARRTDIPEASINLFGGEPLLPITRDAVADILARAAHLGLPISITSNGTYAHEFLGILRKHRNLILFDISMDGPLKIHDRRRLTVEGSGTFAGISKNIGLLLEEGFRVAVRMNLNEDNLDAVPEFLEYVRDRDWSRYKGFQMTLSPVTNYTGRSADGLIPPSELESRLKRNIPAHLLREVPVALNGDAARLSLPVSELLGDSLVPGKFMPSLHYCEAAGALFYCMGPDGLIYPCNQIIGDPSWAIGSYFPELQMDEQKSAMWHGRTVANMPKCRACSIAFLCAGGCPVMAKRTSGSPTQSYCGTSKQELARYIRSVAPRLLELKNEA